jgi:hypothetical protein
MKMPARALNLPRGFTTRNHRDEFVASIAPDSRYASISAILFKKTIDDLDVRYRFAGVFHERFEIFSIKQPRNA